MEHQELMVTVAAPGAEAWQADRLAARLRTELQQLDIEDIAAAPGQAAPEGAKAGDVATWSTLLLTLAASGGVITTVVGAVRDWIVRQPAPTVVEISIGGDAIRLENVPADDQQPLMDAFLARHAREP
jgi:hypothetical protein